MEDNNLIISQYSSLNFSKWKHHFERREDYAQPFSNAGSVSDKIRVQLSILQGKFIRFELVNLTAKQRQPVPLTRIGVRGQYTIYYFEYDTDDFEAGEYRIEAINDIQYVVAYSDFNICNNELRDTVLIRYTNRQNIFDAYFLNGDDTNNYFDFRIEGGFLYKDFQFGGESNGFKNQNYNNVQLSSYPTELRTLTIGSSFGVPVWVGRKINLIFSLSDTTIDGRRYVRGDGSETEKVDILSLYPLYVFRIGLEPSDFYSENVLIPDLVVATENKIVICTEDRKSAFLIR
jgi:hypothetical protein